jgi:tetratricopeptide (TPR) repeat protein
MICLCLFAARVSSAQDQTPASPYQQASAAFEQGRFSDAELTLRGVLKDHPQDAYALGMLGVVLDAEKLYAEAEKCYYLALKFQPDSTAVLNNLGNHYLAQGASRPARDTYIRVVRLNPHHENANLHLAEMSLKAREGNSALHYLDQLPPEVRVGPPAEFLRARALYLIGRRTEAENLLDQMERKAHGDPRIPFSSGMIYAEWQRYDEAEQALSEARAWAPANFDVLYNLGLAAANAGHLDRAQEAFEAALRQKNDDVDCLLGLSQVCVERKHFDEAVKLLADAQQLAPERADILLALARATEKTGSYAAAAEAYEKYLRLHPDDDAARRERGFALARTAKAEQALPDLEWYVEKHPKDPIGLYELAVAETAHDRDKAAEYLNQALALDPSLVAARFARGVLDYEDGKLADAEADLQFVVARDPANYRALENLGEVDLELDRLAPAEECLRKATALAPKDSEVLVHYAQVLQAEGRVEAAAGIFTSLKQRAGSVTRPSPHVADEHNGPGVAANVWEPQNLSALQAKIEQKPTDVNLRLELGRSLLAQGKTAEALAAYRQIRSLSSDPEVYAKCGKALLVFRQYGLAGEFLRDAAAAHPSDTDLRLDLAVALSHSAGPGVALAALDEMLPVSGKYAGNYYLLRAQVLDEMGRAQEAADDLNRGFRASPTRTDLYFEGVLFLIKHGRYEDALGLIKQARPLVPDSPQIMTAEAIAYEVSQQSYQADLILGQVQAQWPEWSPSYLLRGLILESHFRWVEARSQLETALALAGDDATGYYYLAVAYMHTSPQNIPAAEKAVYQALRMDPNNATAWSVAGKIALLQKQYTAALEDLNSAVRLDPDLKDAHESLSALYRASGDKEKSIAELKQVLAIKQKKEGTSQSPATISNLLFAVVPPPEEASGAAP